MKKLVLSFLLFTPLFLLAQALPNDFSVLKTEIDSIMAKNDIPGAQLIIVSSDSCLMETEFRLC